jgi:membrane-associated protein
MTEILEALKSHDIKLFAESIGLIGIFLVIFAESGLLIGFFLPGDSLLFTAGFLANPGIGIFNIWTLVIACWVAAIVGDNVGYEFGKRVGRRLFEKKDSKLFKKDHLIKAEEFYKKHGAKSIVLARYVPIVRTFAPIIAGVAHMDQKQFMLYNFLGGTLWVWSLTWGGYFLGKAIPDVDKYILPIVFVIIILSILPPILHLMKERKNAKKDEFPTPDVILP